MLIPPLYLACSKGNAAMAKLLLNKGAECDSDPSTGMNALHAACAHSMEEVALKMLKWDSIREISKSGKTVLMVASEKGLEKVVTKIAAAHVDHRKSIDDTDEVHPALSHLTTLHKLFVNFSKFKIAGWQHCDSFGGGGRTRRHREGTIYGRCQLNGGQQGAKYVHICVHYLYSMCRLSCGCFVLFDMWSAFDCRRVSHSCTLPAALAAWRCCRSILMSLTALILCATTTVSRRCWLPANTDRTR